MKFISYISNNADIILRYTLEHIHLTIAAVGLAILIGIPLGILISYVKKLNKPILGFANVVQAIPSLALLGFAIPFLGIGATPAIAMVVLYSLLPIIKNTHTGISTISPQMIEAAEGLGLTKFQILTRVQIPLALPVMMAGIRISAVTAVGLITIAAFIGAGGLGFLVFSGIRTVNNYLILAGAIPACLLALFIDFLFSIMEKLVTPISLQVKPANSKMSRGAVRRIQKSILAITLFVVVLFTGINMMRKPAATKDVIRIGGKDYTEQHTLAHLLAEYIEGNTDLSVTRLTNLGGTQVCFGALKANEIDMYVEYSGSAYTDTLAYPPVSDVQRVYNTVKKEFKEKFNIIVLPQMQFNNTYALAVRKDTAKKYGLKTISDLAVSAENLVAGTTLEFLNRDDGLPGVMKKYNFHFKDSIGLDSSPRYIALMNHKTDVTDAFSTDGLLKKFNLTLLEDDKSFFPPYYAMPIMTDETAKKFPQLIPLLEKLGTHLTNDVMIDLNYQVDELEKNPEDVAREFLLKEKLISE